MFHKKTLMTLLIAGLVLTAGVVVTNAASNGDRGNGEKPNLDPARHEQMQEIFESGDYAAWVELMGDSPMADQITEENFDQFAEMHQLMMDGDKDGAKTIADELGLEGHLGMGKRGGHHFHGEMKDTNGDGVCNRDDVVRE